MRLHPAEWIRESAGYMKEKNKTGNWLLNAVYPRRCPICDGLLSREELYLCRNCVEKIHPILGARCKKCGKPVGSEEEFCRDCSRTRHSFDRGFAPYGYHGELEASLMRFKYHERQEYAGFYAHAAFFYVGKQIQRRNPEVLVPVPLHPARQRQRGYNQAEVFAEKLAEEMELSLEGIEIVNLRHPDESDRRERYSRILAEKRAREGFTYEEANDKMFERNYFGMMMVETGDADAFITGLYTRYSNTIKVAKEVIGIQPGFKHFGTMHILNSKKGTYFLADTLINRHPDTETLIDIAKLSDKTVRFFNHTPVISMLSYSNFGADTAGSPVKVHEAVAHMQEAYPELAIDGEMQVNFAMNRELRDTKYPFTRLKGKDVNTLIFPNLSSANAGYKLLQAMDPDTEFIGPIQMGLNLSLIHI